MALKYWLSLGLLALVACAPPIRLEQAPNLFHVGARYPADQVPEIWRTSSATMFYVTDRVVESRDGIIRDYSHERSASMAFGESWVEFGEGVGWDELVDLTNGVNPHALSLINNGFAELIRFPATPVPFAISDGVVVPGEKLEREYQGKIEEFQTAIRTQLNETGLREAMIFVHGFNSEFKDALSTTAALWHHSGRTAVPISYSWPAGNPGLFKYFKDRESGEFTIFHLKEFLRALSEMPELDKLHIISHSRGADVVTTALRELILVERSAGRNPTKSLKIENLILAAPDLDFGVSLQRLVAEKIGGAVGQVSLYLNPNDGALGLAQRLATGTRFGRLSVEDLSERESQIFERLENVNFVSVEQAGANLGHSYFRRNPAVFSDIVLTMRTGDLPGGASRPLEKISGNFWTLHENYPAPRPSVLEPVDFSEGQ